MEKTFNPKIHGRHTIRVPGFDYSDPGYYMITACIQDRRMLFGRIRSGRMELNGFGKIAERCIRDVPCHFNHIDVDEWIVMPDHVHVILEIRNIGRGTACRAPTLVRRFGKPERGSIPTIVGAFKSAVTKRIRGITKTDNVIWQRNYWERIIRDSEE
jgi:REP element-mobilizing transposase RayT